MLLYEVAPPHFVPSVPSRSCPHLDLITPSSPPRASCIRSITTTPFNPIQKRKYAFSLPCHGQVCERCCELAPRSCVIRRFSRRVVSGCSASDASAWMTSIFQRPSADLRLPPRWYRNSFSRQAFISEYDTDAIAMSICFRVNSFVVALR